MYYMWHEVCESIPIIHETIAIVCGSWITATCKHLSYASIILAVSVYCLALCQPYITEGRSDLLKSCHRDQALHVSGRRRGEYGLSNLREDELSSLAVDAGQMTIFVARTLRVCSGLVVLMYRNWGQRLLLLSLERWALLIEINADLRHRKTLRYLLLGVSGCIWYNVPTQGQIAKAKNFHSTSSSYLAYCHD